MSEATDIGKQLSKARENKNLSHADIAESTRIPAATLAALEREDYSGLSPAYARSFLAQYSEYLGVDASVSIDSLQPDDTLTQISDHSYLQKGHDRVRKKGEKSSKTRRKKQKGARLSSLPLTESIRNSIPQPLAMVLTLLVAVALIIGGGLYAYKKYNGRSGLAANDQAIKIKNSTPRTNGNDPARKNIQPAESDVVSVAHYTELFDPLSSTHKLLVMADDSDTDETRGVFKFGASNFDRFSITPPVTVINQEANNELTERNSPPPKAMLIDEDDE